jgi:hypothetical protein
MIVGDNARHAPVIQIQMGEFHVVALDPLPWNSAIEEPDLPLNAGCSARFSTAISTRDAADAWSGCIHASDRSSSANESLCGSSTKAGTFAAVDHDTGMLQGGNTAESSGSPSDPVIARHHAW